MSLLGIPALCGGLKQCCEKRSTRQGAETSGGRCAPGARWLQSATALGPAETSGAVSPRRQNRTVRCAPQPQAGPRTSREEAKAMRLGAHKGFLTRSAVRGPGPDVSLRPAGLRSERLPSAGHPGLCVTRLELSLLSCRPPLVPLLYTCEETEADGPKGFSLLRPALLPGPRLLYQPSDCALSETRAARGRGLRRRGLRARAPQDRRGRLLSPAHKSRGTKAL
ncbi:uncharacterized protein [Petaurus breviceps papuanus]|uniref:uncharacterized protein n=1 Tax=Petaurus breviceps papuanus TaxID=3040969 RepID=UPI0036DD8902